jgi:hypothetical protein
VIKSSSELESLLLNTGQDLAKRCVRNDISESEVVVIVA